MQEIIKCCVKNCEANRSLIRGYCLFHYRRLIYHRKVPMDSPKRCLKSETIKNRNIVLEKSGGRCYECTNEAMEIHHIDLNRRNNNLNNLKPLCYECHHKYHNYKKDKNTIPLSKFRRKYGMTLKEISNKLNLTSTMIYKYQSSGALKNMLNNNK